VIDHGSPRYGDDEEKKGQESLKRRFGQGWGQGEVKRERKPETLKFVQRLERNQMGTLNPFGSRPSGDDYTKELARELHQEVGYRLLPLHNPDTGSDARIRRVISMLLAERWTATPEREAELDAARLALETVLSTTPPDLVDVIEDEPCYKTARERDEMLQVVKAEHPCLAELLVAANQLLKTEYVEMRRAGLQLKKRTEREAAQLHLRRTASKSRKAPTNNQPMAQT
jgi:hypothetical protein